MHSQSGSWVSVIEISGKHRHIGLFASPEDAAFAFDGAFLRWLWRGVPPLVPLGETNGSFHPCTVNFLAEATAPEVLSALVPLRQAENALADAVHAAAAAETGVVDAVAATAEKDVAAVRVAAAEKGVAAVRVAAAANVVAAVRAAAADVVDAFAAVAAAEKDVAAAEAAFARARIAAARAASAMDPFGAAAFRALPERAAAGRLPTSNGDAEAEAALEEEANCSCSSLFRGVSFHESRGKWKSIIRISKKDRHVGYFFQEEDAAWAYDAAFLRFQWLGDVSEIVELDSEARRRTGAYPPGTVNFFDEATCPRVLAAARDLQRADARLARTFSAENNNVARVAAARERDAAEWAFAEARRRAAQASANFFSNRSLPDRAATGRLPSKDAPLFSLAREAAEIAREAALEDERRLMPWPQSTSTPPRVLPNLPPPSPPPTRRKLQKPPPRKKLPPPTTNRSAGIFLASSTTATRTMVALRRPAVARRMVF